MANYIFGNSFDSLAQQKQAIDRQNLDVAEQNRAAQERAYQFNANAQLVADRQAQENARQNSALYYDQVRQQQQQANLDTDRATSAYQFGTQESDRKANEAERKREFDTNVDLSKKQWDTSQNQTKLNAAIGDINSGIITDPSDIPKLHPELNDLQQTQAKAAFDAKSRNDITTYKNIMGIAPALNSDAAMKIAAKAKAGEEPTLSDDEAATIQGKYAKTKGINMLEWDAASQRFVPNAPAPYGFQIPVAPVRAPVTPVAPPPPTGMWNGFKRGAAAVGDAIMSADRYMFPTQNQPAATGPKPLDQGTAIQLLRQTGGDKERARQLARDAGYSF